MPNAESSPTQGRELALSGVNCTDGGNGLYVAVDANRRKMKLNRDALRGDTSGIEQHETS